MPGTANLDQAEPICGTADESTPVFTAAEILGDHSRELVRRVRRECVETGFLIIEPAADLQATIGNTIGKMQSFFSLDDADPRKQDVRQDEARNGWRPRYTEPAYQPGTVSSLEAFDLGIREIRSDDDECWPDMPDFRDTVSLCWTAYLQLADALLELIARAAGLDSGFLVSRCQSRELNSFRLLHYAGDPPASSDKEVGIAAHTDFECITLLYQDAPGLELRSTDGRWLDAIVGVGRIVVLLDDMIERWTNGFFTATGHRVRQTGEQRFSIVMFMAVDDGLSVEPLAPFVSEEAPAQYEPVTQAEHLHAEIQRARVNAEQV